LFEHYKGHQEAAEYSGDEHPAIAAADDVWAHVTCEFVAVAGFFDVLRFWTPLGFRLTTEIGLKTEWDEEHTLAARFADGRFLELCASVTLP
jgi:hypothetical protein